MNRLVIACMFPCAVAEDVDAWCISSTSTDCEATNLFQKGTVVQQFDFDENGDDVHIHGAMGGVVSMNQEMYCEDEDGEQVPCGLDDGVVLLQADLVTGQLSQLHEDIVEPLYHKQTSHEPLLLSGDRFASNHLPWVGIVIGLLLVSCLLFYLRPTVENNQQYHKMVVEHSGTSEQDAAAFRAHQEKVLRQKYDKEERERQAREPILEHFRLLDIHIGNISERLPMARPEHFGDPQISEDCSRVPKVVFAHISFELNF